MIIQVAWKNIWRNPTRSLVVIMAMLIGMFAGTYLVCFAKGMTKQRLDRGIETEISHIQLHHPRFRDADETKYKIDRIEHRCNAIAKLEHVDGVSPRIVMQVMIASAETGSGVKLIGANPELEKKVSNLYTYIKDGAWFEGVKRNPIVIGEKLATKLNVRVRSKVVLTLQDEDGNLISGAFRIAGIFKTVNTGFDERNAFIRDTDLRRLASIPKNIGHEIAVHVTNQRELDATTALLAKMNSNLEVLDWRTLNPEFGYISEVYDYYLYFFIIVILLALGFGIVNTILMAVLERIKELGMLMAIGMKRGRIFRMIMWESTMMSLFGGLLGVILGLGLTLITGRTGVSLETYKSGFEAMGYDSVVYPIIDWPLTINVIVLVLITGIVAAIYPAWKALQLNPAEALRTE